MLILIVGLLAFASGTYLALDFASGSTRLIKTQLRRAASYAVVDRREKEMARSAKERILVPLLGKFSDFAMRLSPAASRMKLARRLQAAGIKASPQVFLSIKGGLPIGGITIGILGAGALGQIGLLPLGLLIATIGWIGPDMFLTRKAQSRRAEMGRRLPDTLDLLTVSVEAGLGFDSAIAKVCEKMTGPLIDELQLMAREIRIGETRRQALRNLADRVDDDGVSAFARSIIQAEELGTSLGRTLRVQAQDLRIKRQLEAEEKAMKAPVKMLFPTVLFIFPAMFIVILGPAALNIMATFSKTSSGG
jgi:tight adherence protein C